MEHPEGIEPSTHRLKVGCSTAELWVHVWIYRGVLVAVYLKNVFF